MSFNSDASDAYEAAVAKDHAPRQEVDNSGFQRAAKVIDVDDASWGREDCTFCADDAAIVAIDGDGTTLAAACHGCTLTALYQYAGKVDRHFAGGT